MPIAIHSLYIYNITSSHRNLKFVEVQFFVWYVCAFMWTLATSVGQFVQVWEVVNLTGKIFGLTACFHWTANFKTIHLVAHVTWTIWRDRPAVWRISGCCSTLIVIHATPDRWHYSYPLYIPSGNLTSVWKITMLLMGKLTINGRFQ